MSAVAASPVLRPRAVPAVTPQGADPLVLGVALALLALGLVMVTSASITSAERQLGQPFYYLLRQLAYAGLATVLALAAWHLPLRYWEKRAPLLLLIAIVLLTLVLIPGVGKTVNHSSRWLSLGLFNLQVSELAKLCAFVYLADYMVRRGRDLRTRMSGLIKPLLPLTLLSVLLLLEPDFGAAAVLLATAMGMLLLGGARWRHFSVLLGVMLPAAAAMALASPYRVERLTTFLNPWIDPFDSGFQLTQALIAFGRGAWPGVGLGAGIQKLFYLPEAHTDFVFSVLAEELGLLGVLTVIALYAVLVGRAFIIGARAQNAGQHFGGYLAYGIGLWLGLQAFINMGVNMGMLPTKGLTLPLMSYGGSSLVMTGISLGLLLRIAYESRDHAPAQAPP